MKDTDRDDDKQRPDGDYTDAPRDRPMASYSAEQRRRVRKGIGILAKVAVRAYLRRLAAPNGGERDGR